MKVYRFKQSDLLHTESPATCDNEKALQVKTIESKTSQEINRFWCKGATITLATTKAGKYILTGRVCYKQSILDLLAPFIEVGKINRNDIIELYNQTNTSKVDIILDDSQVQNLLGL